MVVVAVAALSPALFGDRIPADTDLTRLYGPWTASLPSELEPIQGDSFLVYLPDRMVAAEQWRAGELPLWNPYVSMGVPLLGGQTANPLDPLIALFLTLPPGPAMGLQYALLVALAGLGMVLLLHDRGVTRPEALAVGALAFALCPYLLYWLELRVFLGGLAPLPFVLWAMERVARGTATPRVLAAGSLALGYAALAGTLQTLALVGGLALVRLVWIRFHLRGELVHRPTRGLPGALILLGLGLGVGTIAWVAAADLLRLSTRVTGSAGYYADTNFLPWRALGLWFQPGLFGLGQGTPFVVQEAFGRSPAGSSGWGATGVIPLGLALIALVTRTGPTAERRFWGALAVLVPGLLLLLGTPPGRALMGVIPGLDTVDLLRTLIVASLGVSVLAAYGAQRLLVHLGTGAARWAGLWAGYAVVAVGVITVTRAGVTDALPWGLAVLPAAGLALGAASLGALGRFGRWAAWGLPLLIAAELLSLHFRVNPFAEASTFYPTHPVVTEIRNRLGPPDYPRFLVPSHLRVLPPNVPSVFGLTDLRGYTNMPLDRTRFMLETAEGTTLANQVYLSQADSPIYRSAALGYAFVSPALARKATRFVPEPVRGLPRGFMKRTGALPRAYLVYGVQAVPDRGALREALTDPAWDPSRVALVETGDGPVPAASPPSTPGRASIRRLHPDEVVIRIQTQTPGVLVLADAFHPGWRATINGEPTRVFPVNGGLRGVAVDASTREVVFRYRPVWLWPGLATSLLCLLATLGVGFLPRRRGGTG